MINFKECAHVDLYGMTPSSTELSSNSILLQPAPLMPNTDCVLVGVLLHQKIAEGIEDFIKISTTTCMHIQYPSQNWHHPLECYNFIFQGVGVLESIYWEIRMSYCMFIIGAHKKNISFVAALKLLIGVWNKLSKVEKMYQKKWVIFLFKTYPIKFDFLIFVIFHIENIYNFRFTLKSVSTIHLSWLYTSSIYKDNYS